MSGAKGASNRSAKTSGKNSNNTNVTAQISETKDAEKLQVKLKC